MRQIFEHKIPGQSVNVDIWADERNEQSGTSHNYTLGVPTSDDSNFSTEIAFQNGPVKEVGVNGITNEALLAVLIDRYRGLQLGKFPCRENALTLTKLEEALMWQQKRTRDRTDRGVEGRSEK